MKASSLVPMLPSIVVVARFESFDGTELSYETEGDGHPVLLLHGFASDSFINWVRPGIVDALVREGFRAITLDQRGHGASSKPHDPEAYADGAMVRDAEALMDHLGLQSVLMAGYSMGAINTLRLCASTGRVSAAVCAGIGSTTMGPREGGRSGLADALLTDDKSTVTNSVARSFRDFADLTGADRKALAAIQLSSLPALEDLGGLEIPVLVLCGDNDPLAGDPAPLASALPKGRGVVVGGTHLNVINNPDFQGELVAFLAEQR
jgi:pimeloyl-ACP methyl ester carboxylesterase